MTTDPGYRVYSHVVANAIIDGGGACTHLSLSPMRRHPPARSKGRAVAQKYVNLRHPTLTDANGDKVETAQPASLARALITQGGWELDSRKDRNPDDVTKAFEDVKSGYVGGDQGSLAAGGHRPPDPSGKIPTPQNVTVKGDS